MSARSITAISGAFEDFHALRLGERVAQLEELDVGVLRDQFFDEGPARR